MKNSLIKSQIKEYFQTGDIPTEDEFEELIEAATDINATLTLAAHLFGDSVDVAIAESLPDVSGQLDAFINNYNLQAGQRVLLTSQLDTSENGIYRVEADNTITKLSYVYVDNFLVKAGDADDMNGTFWEAELDGDASHTIWTQQNGFDLPEHLAPYLENNRFPKTIDLTRNHSGSEVKVNKVSATQGSFSNVSVSAKLQANRFEGDGQDLTNLNASNLAMGMVPNERLQENVDLTVPYNNSSVKAKKFIGNGGELTGLNASALTGGTVPSGRIPFASTADIAAANPNKVVSAQHISGLNTKAEALSFPQRIDATIVCVESSSNINLANPPTTIDGVKLLKDQLVLLTAQNNLTENRIWKVHKTGQVPSLVEATEFPPASYTEGQTVVIDGGKEQQGSVYKLKAISGASPEMTWATTSEISLAGIGLVSVNNRLDADLALDADVDQSTAEKIVDAAVLKSQLTKSEDQLTTDLTALIDTEKDRIDAILAASDADKDSFAEIVALINEVDTENDDAFAAYVLANDTRVGAAEQRIADEVTTRGNETSKLTDDLASEVTTRTQESNARYTKTQSDNRYVQQSGSVLNGEFNIDAATFTGDMSVTGAITATADVTAFSDERLKRMVRKIDAPLEKLSQLDGVTFERADFNDGRRYTGLLAQQVQQVMPEAVHGETEFLSVAYGNLVGLLVESVKALNEQVSELQAKLADKQDS